MKRGKPLQRKAPLQANKRMNASTPINRVGQVAKRKAPAHMRVKRIVRERSGGCCEAPGCGRPGVAWAHIFGRGNIVPEPLCSSPELTMDLCPEHHDAIDGRAGTDLDLRERLRWLAVEAVAETADFPRHYLEAWRQDRDAKAALLSMLRQLAEQEAA